jgi:hypothetical protein
MAQAGLLPGGDHQLLAELVGEDHFIVKAAWEYYQVDPKLEELADTLVQLVRIETQRRSLERAKADADADTEVEAAKAEVEAAAEAVDAAAAASSARGRSDGEAAEPSGGQVLDAVPPLFAKVLISALDMEVLSKQQVVCFVEKFAAGDELVKAAWAIFEMQNDVKELVDTLFRIYRVYQEKDAAEARYKAARAEVSAEAADAAVDGADVEEAGDDDDAEDEDDGAAAAPLAGKGADEGMGQLMAILDQCMELLAKREELKARQAAQEGGPQRPPVTPAAFAAVRALGRAKDPLLIAVLADFSEKRDVEQLLNHLYVIALETQAGGAQGALDRAAASAAVPDAQDDDDDEDGEEEGVLGGEVAEGADALAEAGGGSGRLQVTDVQQMGMIVEAMLQEGLVDELEKQALEVLVLKQDPQLLAAFSHFFAAQGSAQKLQVLEVLSAALRERARQELDRLRASIAAGDDDDEVKKAEDGGDEEADEEDDEDEEELVESVGLRGVTGVRSSLAASPPRHVVTITEDEDSYEESDASADSIDAPGAVGDDHSGSGVGEDKSDGDPLAAMTAALASTLDHLGLSGPVKASLIACGDQGRALIIAAIDVFQQTKDVEDLKDTLTRVARHQQDAEHLAALEVRAC